MTPDQLDEASALPVTNDAPLPWTVEPHHAGYRHLVDARGNIVAAIPANAGDLGERIVRAFAVIPELVGEIERLTVQSAARLELAERVTADAERLADEAIELKRERDEAQRALQDPGAFERFCMQNPDAFERLFRQARGKYERRNRPGQSPQV